MGWVSDAFSRHTLPYLRYHLCLLLILFAYGDDASGLILLKLDYGEDLVSLKLIHAVQEG